MLIAAQKIAAVISVDTVCTGFEQDFFGNFWYRLLWRWIFYHALGIYVRHLVKYTRHKSYAPCKFLSRTVEKFFCAFSSVTRFERRQFFNILVAYQSHNEYARPESGKMQIIITLERLEIKSADYMSKYCRNACDPPVLHKSISREKYQNYCSAHGKFASPQSSADSRCAYDNDALSERQIAVKIGKSQPQQKIIYFESVYIYIINSVGQKRNKHKAAYYLVHTQHSAYTSYTCRIAYSTTQKTYHDETYRIHYAFEIDIFRKIHEYHRQSRKCGINHNGVQAHRLGKKIVKILGDKHYHNRCDRIDYSPKGVIENESDGNIHRA